MTGLIQARNDRLAVGADVNAQIAQLFHFIEHRLVAREIPPHAKSQTSSLSEDFCDQHADEHVIIETGTEHDVEHNHNIEHRQGIDAAKGQKSQRANNETDKMHPTAPTRSVR